MIGGVLVLAVFFAAVWAVEKDTILAIYREKRIIQKQKAGNDATQVQIASIKEKQDGGV